MNNVAPDQDFSQFFLNDTSPVEIDLPDGEPMLHQGHRVVVHVFGPGTAEYVQARKDADADAARRAVALMGVKSKKAKNKDPDDFAEQKFLAAITQRIDNFNYPGGAFGVYTEPRLVYINNQVQAHIRDLGNFFGSGNQS